MNRGLVGVALLVVALVALPTPASASESGPCTITVAGTDLAADGVRVQAPADGDIAYTLVAPSPVMHWTMTVHYGPFAIPLVNRDFPDNGDLTRSGGAPVADIAKYGKGLYEVTGDATLADGTHCTVAFQLQVNGPILSSVLGIAAVALVGAGAVGLLAMLINILLNLNDVRSAIKDFIAHARKTKEEAEARREAVRLAASQTPDSTQEPKS